MAVWTGYVFLLGVVMLTVPNVLLSIFQIENTDEVWIRVVGMLLIGYGMFYWTAVRSEITDLYEMSVWVRWFVVVVLVVLAFTVGPWQLMLFAAVDLLGGLWTFLSLKGQPATAQV